MDGEDDGEDYYEVEAEGGEDSEDEELNADDEEPAAIMEEDSESGEDGGYQPTNPLHYIRMIRQILSGYETHNEQGKG